MSVRVSQSPLTGQSLAVQLRAELQVWRTGASTSPSTARVFTDSQVEVPPLHGGQRLAQCQTADGGAGVVSLPSRLGRGCPVGSVLRLLTGSDRGWLEGLQEAVLAGSRGHTFRVESHCDLGAAAGQDYWNLASATRKGDPGSESGLHAPAGRSKFCYHQKAMWLGLRGSKLHA